MLKSTYPTRFRVQFRAHEIKVYMEAMCVRAIVYEEERNKNFTYTHVVKKLLEYPKVEA